MGLQDVFGSGKERSARQELALKRAFDSLLVTTRSNIEFSDLSPASPEDAVSNTRWFLIEENANYELADELVTDDSDGMGNFADPSNPPTPGKGTFIRMLVYILVSVNCRTPQFFSVEKGKPPQKTLSVSTFPGLTVLYNMNIMG